MRIADEHHARWQAAGGGVAAVFGGVAAIWWQQSATTTVGVRNGVPVVTASDTPLWPAYIFGAIALVGLYVLIAPLLHSWPFEKPARKPDQLDASRSSFVGETISTSDLVRMLGQRSRFSGLTFEDCTFPGPAMMAFPGSNLSFCEWDEPTPLPIKTGADIRGAFSFVGCSFTRCRFQNVTPLVVRQNIAHWNAMFVK